MKKSRVKIKLTEMIAAFCCSLGRRDYVRLRFSILVILIVSIFSGFIGWRAHVLFQRRATSYQGTLVKIQCLKASSSCVNSYELQTNGNKTYNLLLNLTTTIPGGSAVVVTGEPDQASPTQIHVKSISATESPNTVTPVVLNKDYYPNPRYYTSYYLNGNNYGSSTKAASVSPSVLWFQADPTNTTGFYQYNSGPSVTATTDKPSQAIDTCHWDHLAWTNSGLVYDKTNNTCGANNNQIVYSPGVTFMPVIYASLPYSQGGWQASGSSGATYTDNGTVTCRGVNNWQSKNMGIVTLTGTEKALWFQDKQVTTWTNGYDTSTGCGVVNGIDQTTAWEEDFYLVQALPFSNSKSTTYALAREAGGNTYSYGVNGHWDYDVWFNSWTPLP